MFTCPSGLSFISTWTPPLAKTAVIRFSGWTFIYLLLPFLGPPTTDLLEEKEAELESKT
jgi:hypothetical protein